MHPWGAVGAPGSLMDLADQPSQLRVADRPGARRAALPGVEPRAGHLEGRQSRLTPKAWRCSETNRKRLTGSSPWRNRLPCAGFRVPSAARPPLYAAGAARRARPRSPTPGPRPAPGGGAHRSPSCPASCDEHPALGRVASGAEQPVAEPAASAAPGDRGDARNPLSVDGGRGSSSRRLLQGAHGTGTWHSYRVRRPPSGRRAL